MAINNNKAQINLLNASINLGRGDVSSDSDAQSLLLAKSRELTNLFKRDLYMFAEGNLFSDENSTEELVDLKVVTGVYNYAQAITHRLMTDRGTLPADDSFGVPWSQYLGQIYTNKSIILANLIRDIQDEIHKDSRTQRVISVNAVFDDPNTIKVDCIIVPVGLFTEVGINVILGIT